MAGIRFQNISFAYGERPILRDFSLTVEDAQILCLLGPSGCGKTTLMRCLLGLNRPSSGEIWLGDRCLFSKERRINVPPERRGIGVVFQDYAVWPHMTVLENVCYPLKKRRVPKEEMERKAKYALSQVRMEPYAPYLPSQLSGGQQQRVAIARALVSSDEVIVMDEPITNLDAKLREEMLAEIRQIQKDIGTTVLYITHDQEASLQLGDRMAIMDANGALCQLGTDEDIILRPAERFVFEFIGVSNFFTLRRSGGVWSFASGVPYDGAVPSEFESAGCVDMGVRPNDIAFDEASTVRGIVRRSVFLGSEYNLFIDLNGQEGHGPFPSEVRVQRSAFEGIEGIREGVEVGLSFLNPKFYPAKGHGKEAA
ncbi:MAG: ABC transporter ATP-binding protein [Synergistaceae bacterium]|nr:ABC transporter ATP-binding protein [Synergistaceae bacterium]